MRRGADLCGSGPAGARMCRVTRVVLMLHQDTRAPPPVPPVTARLRAVPHVSRPARWRRST
jgi:hypothetical protein